VPGEGVEEADAAPGEAEADLLHGLRGRLEAPGFDIFDGFRRDAGCHAAFGAAPIEQRPRGAQLCRGDHGWLPKPTR
jgi:hypothetical protein